MKNPGIIVQTDKGEFGIAYDKEQHEAFAKINKIYIHLFSDRLCTQPKKDPVTGKNIVTLKDISKIRPIGFVD